MDKKSKADLDRNLYEYQRQLDAPKIFADKYPNISKAVDSKILHKDNQDIYNTLGKNTEEDKNIIESVKPFKWVRDSEENASDAVGKDYYKTTDPMELLQALRKENGLDFNTQLNDDPNNSGMYNPNNNTLNLSRKQTRKSAFDAAMHEAGGHAKDWKDDPEAFDNKTTASENVFPPSNLKEDMDRWQKMKESGNLYDLSDEVSTNHFLRPRSHSINNLIDKAELLGKENGLSRLPDRNPKYNELNSIKPTLKELQGYDPKKEGIYDKLKKLLTR